MAELNFDSNKGVVIPETQDVRTDLAASVQEAFRTDPSQPVLDTDATSPMGQVVDIIAAEVQAKNSEIAFLAAMSSLSTSRGAFLDALGSLYGVERKLSEPTIVTCICTGLKGTTIPYGAIVQDSLGNQFRHSAAGGASIGEAGTVQTTFSSVEHGEIEVLPDSVTKIVTIVAGWDSITNPDSGATGRAKEPDGEYMNRIMQSYAINALGSLEAIQAKLSSVDGVLDCVVLENFTNEYQTKYGIRIDPHCIFVWAAKKQNLPEIHYDPLSSYFRLCFCRRCCRINGVSYARLCRRQRNLWCPRLSSASGERLSADHG